MRVVCDNCGAVYKIGDSKLVKDVNKATCKRCGHKIMIFRPGVNDSGEDTAHAEGGGSEGDERTVIKNVSDLEQLSRSQGAVPSIGSLTAELRAISLPGISASASPAPPQTLGPLPPVTGPTPPPVPSFAPPLPPPPLASAPLVPPVAAAAVPGPMPVPPASMAHAQRPEPARAGPALTPPPVVPPMGPSRPPTRDDLRLSPTPGLMGTPTVPGAVTSPNLGPKLDSTAMALQAATGTGPPGTGSAELGALGGVGMIGLLGVAASTAMASPVNCVGTALAGFAMGTTLFLPLLSERGRRAGRIPMAMVLGLAIGGTLGYAHCRQGAATTPGQELTAADPPSFPASVPTPAPPPPVVPATPADAPPPIPAPSQGLSPEEREALRAAQATPAPPPKESSTPERVAAVTKAPPKESPTPAPKPPPEAKTPPKEPTPGVKEPVAPAPPGGGESKSGSGPTPFVIDTMIRTNASVLRCFSAEKAKGADVSGKIYLKFSIAPEGAVSRARITTSRFAGTDLDACVSKEVNALRFPAFEGQTQQVTYPFIVN
jgi:predicted Zn finger-like uncharacterized protein